MGVLDDAIREHLELKRRHGADAAEVAREEQDALGPVRREPEAVAEPEEGRAGEAAAFDEALEPEPADADPADAATELLVPESPESAPADLQAAEPPVDDDAPAPRLQRLEPPGEVPAAPPSPTGAVAAGDAPPEPASDDVLEETPEFLQETPEHDRLWFEQRPPRDFDFDK